MPDDRIPIFLRAGDDGTEREIGHIAPPPGCEPQRLLPGLLRDVADEIERLNRDGDLLAALDAEAETALPDELRGGGPGE